VNVEVDALRALLDAVAAGAVSPATALRRLRHLPYEPVGDAEGHPFARIDHHRALRQAVPEVVYCPGKDPGHVAAIAERIAHATGRLLATRATEEQFQAVRDRLPEVTLHALARTITLDGEPRPMAGRISLLTAGTADLPVAEEVRVVAKWLGSQVTPLYDVGVAGLHRILEHAHTLTEARVVVVVAGMDGVLPSVIGGLTARPIIAVPTSTGYGANFQGVAPLLTMLNACPPGIGVVNIDNGFGAACLAHRINMTAEERD
jgi:NCAIR mutase (PurE)-related protein